MCPVSEMLRLIEGIINIYLKWIFRKKRYAVHLNIIRAYGILLIKSMIYKQQHRKKFDQNYYYITWPPREPVWCKVWSGLFWAVWSSGKCWLGAGAHATSWLSVNTAKCPCFVSPFTVPSPVERSIAVYFSWRMQFGENTAYKTQGCMC